jgi:hypothetical protein
MYTCYVGSHAAGMEGAVIYTGQDIKGQIKWLDLSMR